jgi:hypothetical protein
VKHACVAARIGEGKAPVEGNSRSTAKTSNAASRGGRSRFQALCAWMRPRSATRSAPNPRDSRAPPRSHPRKRGASEGGRGTPWDLTPQTRMGSAIRAHDRLHGRIPIDGAPAPRCADPCSTLRCAADSGCNPSGWHEFWPTALSKGPLLRMTKPQDFLLALSQNRDSASRVSLCYGL